MAEAIILDTEPELDKTTAASVVAGEVHQLSDGRAGVFTGLADVLAGVRAEFAVTGKWVVPKTSGVVLLDGDPVYWDHSANSATFRSVSDRDFYLGTAVGDWGSAATYLSVNLNVKPEYKVDLLRDGFASVLVGTPAAGGFNYPVALGGSLVFELTSTSEAQKVDALSTDGFALASNWIVEGSFRVISDGAGSAPDFTIGVASGTHASDFQSVAEFAALHLDGNALDINAQSDDGTTDVAPTDTTVNYTEGSTLACRVEFRIDGRNPSDIQFYIDGVLVLDGTTFTLAAATGPLFLVVHLEKTSAADVYKVAVDKLRVRTAQD